MTCLAVPPVNNRVFSTIGAKLCRFTPLPKNQFLSSVSKPYRNFSFRHRRISTRAMSRRPNFQGGRRGGGGGIPGRGGGGRGEQRWWDPVWRAERLRQKAAEMEVLNEEEWWGKMEQLKRGGEREMVIKRQFSRDDQQILEDMAFQMGLHFHAYNKGKTLVVSKVPLPDYRADLDERHGSTQKEIRMSSETETRVGNLLQKSEMVTPANGSSSTSGLELKEPPVSLKVVTPVPTLESDNSNVKPSVELKQREEELKASNTLKEMLSFREKLPAFKVRGEFLKAIAENQREKKKKGKQKKTMKSSLVVLLSLLMIAPFTTLATDVRYCDKKKNYDAKAISCPVSGEVLPIYTPPVGGGRIEDGDVKVVEGEDRLILRGLKFHGFHGVKPEERALGQKFLVDVDAWMDLLPAGISDSLSDTISYTDIYRIVKEVVEGTPKNLLESVAQLIATTTLTKYPQITAVRVKIGKPHVAVHGSLDYLGVEILRRRRTDSQT